MSQQRLSASLSAKFNIKKIYEEEDEDNFIYSIREEIVQQALHEIDTVVQEQHAYEMVAECAIQALSKVVALNFYFHMDPVDIAHPNWSPDEPVPPSPPDSWAARMTAVRPSPAKKPVSSTDEEDRTLCPIEGRRPSDCVCLFRRDDMIQEQIKELFSEQKPKKVRKSAASSSFTDLRVESEKLTPIQVTETELLTDYTESQRSVKMKKKAAVPRSEVSFRHEDFTLPVIEVPSPIDSKMPSTILELELPPIRIDATYQCIPVESPPKKKSVRKRKKDKKYIIN